MKIDRIRLLIAAGGATIAVAGIAAGAYALHDAAAPPAASQHKIAARSSAVPAVSAAADGATTETPDPAASTPGQQSQPQPASQQQTTTTAPVQPPPADPSPTGTQSPAPVVLTACAELGTTATDAGGNLVQCAGNAAAPEWVCDPDYSYPSTYPPVPGQPAPPTWQTVLDTSWNAYVMDPAGTWLVTSPPC